MECDTKRVDEAVLGLLFLTLHDDVRAWKGYDWDSLNRLHERGLILNPVSKTKSVVFTEEGLEAARAAFERLFCHGGSGETGTAPAGRGGTGAGPQTA